MLALLIACGGSEDRASEITSATTAPRFASTGAVEIEPLALTGEFAFGDRFGRLLARIPATADNRRSLLLNDFIPIWKAWGALGAVRPTNEHGLGAMERFFNDLAVNRTGNALFVRPRVDAPRISGFDTIGGVVNTFAYLGFDQRNVDGAALAGPGAAPMELVVGDYDIERSAAALEACDDCREHELIDYAGSQYYAWGEELAGDLSDRFAPPLYDHAGRGGRFAIDDGIAMRTLTSSQMEALLDAAAGNAPNLLGDSDFLAAASAHNAVGTYSAWFSNLPFNLEDGAVVAVNANPGLGIALTTAALRSAPALAPFRVISVGWGVDTAVAYGVLVLVHDDEAAARQNADLLAERFRRAARVNGDDQWASVIDRAEVGSIGNVLIAKLFPHPEQTLYLVDYYEFAYGLAVYE